MIWGWQGGHGKASRMTGPAQLVATQTIVPFLFSPAEQETKAVTHAAVSGLVIHRTDRRYDELASWLAMNRIEHFSAQRHEAGIDVASLYVVTAARMLEKPIPYPQLTVLSTGKPLSPEKRRGYAMVWLPAALDSWFQMARQTWKGPPDHRPG